MIKKCHILPFCHVHCCIGIACNPKIAAKLLITDSRILLHILADHRPCRIILSTSICQTKFQLSISLVQYRFDHFPEKYFRCTINWHYNTDQWFLDKMMFSLQFLLAFRGTIEDHPFLISPLQCISSKMLSGFSVQLTHSICFYILITTLSQACVCCQSIISHIRMSLPHRGRS